MRNPRKQALLVIGVILAGIFIFPPIVKALARDTKPVPQVQQADGETKYDRNYGLYPQYPSPSEEMQIMRQVTRELEIQKAKQAAKKAKEDRERRKRAAALKAKRSRSVGHVSGGTGGSKKTAGKWKGTHAQWDRIARATLKAGGCSTQEVEMMMYIHHHESNNPNAIGGAGNNFFGGWQLKRAIACKIAWWDPAISTARALRYVRGHKYQGYGSGVKAAYLHKKAHGWY